MKGEGNHEQSYREQSWLRQLYLPGLSSAGHYDGPYQRALIEGASGCDSELHLPTPNLVSAVAREIWNNDETRRNQEPAAPVPTRRERGVVWCVGQLGT